MYLYCRVNFFRFHQFSCFCFEFRCGNRWKKSTIGFFPAKNLTVTGITMERKGKSYIWKQHNSPRTKLQLFHSKKNEIAVFSELQTQGRTQGEGATPPPLRKPGDQHFLSLLQKKFSVSQSKNVPWEFYGHWSQQSQLSQQSKKASFHKFLRGFQLFSIYKFKQFSRLPPPPPPPPPPLPPNTPAREFARCLLLCTLLSFCLCGERAVFVVSCFLCIPTAHFWFLTLTVRGANGFCVVGS